jgi:hypothetical protein
LPIDRRLGQKSRFSTSLQAARFIHESNAPLGQLRKSSAVDLLLRVVRNQALNRIYRRPYLAHYIRLLLEQRGVPRIDIFGPQSACPGGRHGESSQGALNVASVVDPFFAGV